MGERAWLIYFDDAARDVEVFVGAGAEAAARSRSEQVGQAWTHTLFVDAAALAEARQALREYGEHHSNCPCWPWSLADDAPYPDCTCGFADARAALAPVTARPEVVT